LAEIQVPNLKVHDKAHHIHHKEPQMRSKCTANAPQCTAHVQLLAICESL
jgi:hypothetical protein